MNSIIESLGVYLPDKKVSTSEVLDKCVNRLPASVFERLTGIRQRHMAGETEFSIDLAAHAVEQCLQRSQYGPADIDLIVCCNISRCDEPRRFSFEPSTAIRLKQHFGLKNARCFDISNACAGTFTGVAVADAFLKSGAAQRVLVVSGEYITHLTRTAQIEIENLLDTRMACLTLGDSGIALLLERSADANQGFHHLEIFTLGAYSDLCIAKESGNKHGGAIMYTESAQLAGVAMAEGAKHAHQTMLANNWAPEQVDFVIPHQTSAPSIAAGVSLLNDVYERSAFSMEKTAKVVGDYGNTSTTSHFVALMDAIQKGRVNTGDDVLFSIMASGITVGTALYRFDDLPDRMRTPRPKSVAPAAPRRSSRTGGTKMKIAGIGTLNPGHRGVGNAVQMACDAAQMAIRDAGISSPDIGLLLYAGVYRNEFLSEPALAAMVAGDLRLNANKGEWEHNRTFAFDVLNGSLGFLDACSVATEMLRTGKAAHALVCAAEIENNAVHQLGLSLLDLEETASALVLSPDEASGFSHFFFRQYPAHLGQYRVDSQWLENGTTVLEIQRNIYMETFYVEHIVEMLRDFEAETGLRAQDFDFVIPPQISSGFVRQFAQKTRVHLDKVIDVTEGKRDLYTSSVGYAFEELFVRHMPRAGQKVLVIGVGAGIQVGCAVYEV
jgi:3-oxoacyl-(acyl-carrier-protein) synthase III